MRTEGNQAEAQKEYLKSLHKGIKAESRRILDTCGLRVSYLSPEQKALGMVISLFQEGPSLAFQTDELRFKTTTTELNGDEREIDFATDEFIFIRYNPIIIQVEGDSERLDIRPDRASFNQGTDDKYGPIDSRDPDASELERYLGLIKRASRRPNLRGGRKIRNLFFVPRLSFEF